MGTPFRFAMSARAPVREGPVGGEEWANVTPESGLHNGRSGLDDRSSVPGAVEGGCQGEASAAQLLFDELRDLSCFGHSEELML